MPKKNSITFNKPPEPEFIRRMKEKAGWKEGPTVDTKLQNDTADDTGDGEEDEERISLQDEQPTVVVLKEGDLTAEEADEIQRDLDLDDKTPGKFQFRKPDKLKQTSSRSSFTSSTKRQREDEETRDHGRNEEDKRRKATESTDTSDRISKPRTKPVLSFADDDEDEDE